MGSNKRTFAVINLTAIKSNIITLKSFAPNRKMLATIKADAYGHGAVEVAQEVENLVDYFGVATVKEAVILRKSGINKSILLLGYIDESDFDNVISYNVIISIYNQYIYEKFSEYLAKHKISANVHIAIDSGMSRLGFAFDTQFDNIKEVCNNESMIVQGIFTHLSCADNSNKSYNKMQHKNFSNLINKLKSQGIDIPLVHTDSTAAIILGGNTITNLVRPGIGIYGVNPTKSKNLELDSALELHSVIADIHLIPKGRGVGYGKTFTAKSITKVATIAIGYADGLPRAMSSGGRVIINGEFAPIIGRVCMDYIMVDISNISCAQISDKVTIIGKNGEKSITVNEVAKICKTITYEIFTQITQRTEKIFVKSAILK